MSAVLAIIRRQRKKRRRPPTRRPRWLVALLALAAVATVSGVALAAYAFLTAPFMSVRTITVRGTERLTESDFRTVLEHYRGEPILLLRLDRVRIELERSPGVREARVVRRLPDALEAVVVERKAVARAAIAGRDLLVDGEGMLFSSLKALPGDAKLPELRGLSTLAGETRLCASDRPAIDALLALARVTGREPPEGTTVDLTPRDRIVLRPGRDAPALWLDRNQPERNLKNLFAWKDRVAAIVPGGSVDLRFPHRLTLVPPPNEAGTATE